MSLSIAAAPQGARIGLVAARRGDQQILVTVSPKAWRPMGPRQLVLDGSDWGGHTQISLYETERLHVLNARPDTSMLLWDVLGASRQADGEVPTWDSSLLSPDIPMHKSV